MNTLPKVKDLVLVGGGHTHALVLRAWGMNPLAGVRVTVINPAPTAAYSGMLPGFVAGHYTRDELDIDLLRLARFAGARMVVGIVTEIDKDAKMITVPGRPPIAYDLCSIDIGITSEMPKLKGFTEHAIPAKPLAPFAHKWNAFRTSHSEGNIAVIGGGVAGVELAMAMQHAVPKAKVRILDRSKSLTAVGLQGRNRLKRQLTDMGIELVEGASGCEVTADSVVLENGDAIPSDFTVGAAGAEPFEWPKDIGLNMHDGFIAVDATLRSSDPNIFAVGDCAHLTASPRSKAGVFAVREAPFLFDNLRAVLSGGALTNYDPQRDYLKLISMGGKSAMAEKFGRAFHGPLLWKWKDRIDRAFMTKLEDLPVMAKPEVPRTAAIGLKEVLGDKPLCAGCGSKVGNSALKSALTGLPRNARKDVERLPSDDAGVLTVGGQKQVISTDHLRAFTEDPVIMARISAVHALGDIWAMGANPQAATANIVLPQMSEDLQSRTLSEVMSAAQEVFADAGAEIVGGHSSMGAEMSIGFTVTGLLDRDPITLGGAQDGDQLMLTKPIGSGVILAAEMAGAARGWDVHRLFERMCQGQGAAADILSDSHAMTDVTGFGLLGHLWGMCEQSQVAVELTQAAVPFFDGAEALSNEGHRSSIFGSNVASVGAVEGTPHDLLFDPQTSGGLLAAVSGDMAADCVAKLRAAGYEDAMVIGRIIKGPATIKVI
ncbi:selenophosphate synthase [Cognatiyoonia sediminum]|uniref:Selenophosphate synthase n=1 Tax=Cognatiyoonia sediminum TaxID=1508389 RepID=A0A1M5RFF6_9RHOB|nr:selenide, water dikinase SelD [Cognatiyoonia sediminum]SHH24836.1 selenophosphate synthase [Cognatiyoonia sediminum]